MWVWGVCVWPVELNCCIPADCTQVLLNLPTNIDLLSKQLWICAPHETRWLDWEVVWVLCVFERLRWIFTTFLCRSLKIQPLIFQLTGVYSAHKIFSVWVGGGKCPNVFSLYCHQTCCITAHHRILFLRTRMHARDSQQPEITPQKTFQAGLSHRRHSYTTWTTPERKTHKCRRFVSHNSASISPRRVEDVEVNQKKVPQTYRESNGSHGNTPCELSTRYETLRLMNSLFLQRGPFGAPATVSRCHRREFTLT